MAFKQAIFLVVLGLAAMAMGHEGMIDNEHVRDVGVVFSEPNFTGASEFVWEMKHDNDCIALDTPVASIQICKPETACTFFTGGDCVQGPNNRAVAATFGDVAEVETPYGNKFTHYSCKCDTGAIQDAEGADMVLDSAEHQTGRQ